MTRKHKKYGCPKCGCLVAVDKNGYLYAFDLNEEIRLGGTISSRSMRPKTKKFLCDSVDDRHEFEEAAEIKDADSDAP